MSAIRSVTFICGMYLVKSKINREAVVVRIMKIAGITVIKFFRPLTESQVETAIKERAAKSWLAVPKMGHSAAKVLKYAKTHIKATAKAELNRNFLKRDGTFLKIRPQSSSKR